MSMKKWPHSNNNEKSPMFYLTQQKRGSFEWRRSGCRGRNKWGERCARIYSRHTLGHAWRECVRACMPALLLLFAPPAKWNQTFAAKLVKHENKRREQKTCAYSCLSVIIFENATGILRESNKVGVLEMQSALSERARLETEPRLEWALCPEGRGGSLHSPCPHYGRQGARPRINGDGLDTNTGRMW